MNDNHRREAGVQGEDAALKHLEAAGLQLLARNYRCKAGEIDLVMLDRSVLTLIEVRYRRTHDFGGAAASVTWRKQQRLLTAARHMLYTRAELRGYRMRFDVVAIDMVEGRSKIEWIKDAFRA